MKKLVFVVVRAALLAIRHGVNVYVEKPMAHTMEEVIRIGEEGRKAGVVVRVGNKGHNISHRPTLEKYLKEGVIGDVTEVFSYSDRPNTMFRRPHTIPVPEGMDWDLWCGGSPVCEPYGEEDGRVGLHPHDWHSWIDYGNGSIGNMGTHVLDAPFQTMDMWKVKPSKIVVRDIKWGCPGAWNARGTLDFHMPARDGWGPIVLHWNDGVSSVTFRFELGWTFCKNFSAFAFVEQYEIVGQSARHAISASSYRCAHNDWTLGGIGCRIRF